MATALTPLANITLGSNQATVTFSSISGAYRDLYLVANYGQTANAYTHFRMNSDSGSNYNMIVMEGNGTSALTNSFTHTQFWNSLNSNSYTTSRPSWLIHLMDYSATDKHKSVLWRADSSDSLTVAASGRWASTSAITSVSFFMSGGSFTSGSTFALYGVSA